MPVTLHPRPDLTPTPIASNDNIVRPVRNLLYEAYRDDHYMIKDILASTYPQPDVPTPVNPRKGSRNGFVYAALDAYVSHHHLILRPEDVWFAILAQFSLFINANAERVRDLFVEHAGQKALEVLINPGCYGDGARMLAAKIQDNVKVEGLKEVLLPSFSTTTHVDKEVGSVMMMGAMQKYFRYTMREMCGLPRVTLLGEKEDYMSLCRRLAFLEALGLGEEFELWCAHVQPVLEGLVNSFDGDSEETSIFWNEIVNYHKVCISGHSDRMSGWLTAFCFWNKEGKVLFECSKEQCNAGCKHEIAVDKVPSGVVSVSVKVIFLDGETVECKMYAGVGAMEFKSTSDTKGGDKEEEADDANCKVVYDAIQPLSGWWLCSFDDTEAIKQRRVFVKPP